jgi:hypothetical protein
MEFCGDLKSSDISTGMKSRIHQKKLIKKISPALIFQPQYTQLVYRTFSQMLDVIQIDPVTIPEKIAWMHTIHSQFYIPPMLARYIPIYCLLLAEQECYVTHHPFPVRSLLNRYSIQTQNYLHIKQDLLVFI